MLEIIKICLRAHGLPEAGLNSTCQANKDGSTDNGRNAVSSGVDDGPQYTERASNDHEPSAAKDVAQSTDQGQSNTGA